MIKLSDLVNINETDLLDEDSIKLLENQALIELIRKHSIKQYLESIWHPNTEKPTKPIIIGKFKDYLYISTWTFIDLFGQVFIHNNGTGLCGGFMNIEKWCYPNDILPKI